MIEVPAVPLIHPERWKRLRYHAEQARLKKSTARFKVIEGGRRSGKTEYAKRDEVRKWLMSPRRTGRSDWLGRFYAPTRDHVKTLYWDDLNERVPDELVAKRNVTELTIRHIAGPTLQLIGMDKPARADGIPVDSAKVDEIADMKPGVWDKHIRPSLDTDGRLGSAWIYGVTRYSKQFEDLAEFAKSGIDKDWDYFWWPSSSVLPPEVIEAARRGMDPRTFEQEYGAKRVPMSDRAYYTFDRETHLRDSLPYNANAPLILCLDFNRTPGSGVVCQEGMDPTLGACTFAIDEIHIPYDSNTPEVCRAFAAKWGHHKAGVHVYADPTGGNRTSATLAGSAHDLVRDTLRPVFEAFHDRMDRKTMPENDRVLALCYRLRDAAGEVHMLIDRKKCPSLVADFDHMLIKKGTDGELWKDLDEDRGHWADGVGYYVQRKFPIQRHTTYQGTL